MSSLFGAGVRAQPFRCVASSRSAVLCCSGTYDESIDHLSGRFRRNISRLERRASRRGKITCEFIRERSALQHAIQEFIEVEDDGWKGEEGTSIASESRLTRFYTRLVENSSDADQWQVNFLRIGQQALASHFGVVSGDTYYILKIGYRERFADLGPGNLLLKHLIDRLCRDKRVRQICFVTDPDWAAKWKSDSLPLYSYVAYARSLRGSLMGLRKAIRDRWILDSQ
ncbi:GNAT family N-acetyltransferase [Lentisalinibacter sediminis]|uniref:GNAT family N-acetyltransferase n=1 Tax=Lentisalinibacter sediminis TaxID=2992237 RepID=UPI00386B68B4